jgi:putative hemolysin
VIVIFGKSIPKLYAAHQPRVAFKPTMALLRFFQFILAPFNFLLVGISTKLESMSNQTSSKRQNQSIHDIDTAIDLTMTNNSESSAQEADILKGIVKFSDKTTKQIMTPRHDIVGIDKDTNYRDVIKLIKEFSYSRLPVYDEDLDKVLGIIYVKDLLEHYDADDRFDWLVKMRSTVVFAPETKKIDELLREFQLKRAHMAIIVDEYGGTTGLVTLEDIMEEIVGEIRDEFDNDEDTHYIKIADNSYIFDGKVSLKDVCRIIGVESSYYDNVRANADSLGGLILALMGHLPSVDRELKVNGTTIKVITVTKRRIEKVSLIKTS